MAKKVKVNGNCIGCGVCAASCPDVFELTDEGTAHNYLGDDTELPEDLEDSVAEAAASCPVEAIEVE